MFFAMIATTINVKLVMEQRTKHNILDKMVPAIIVTTISDKVVNNVVKINAYHVVELINKLHLVIFIFYF